MVNPEPQVVTPAVRFIFFLLELPFFEAHTINVYNPFYIALEII